MKPIPCGGCGRAKEGPKGDDDCHWCWLALNHTSYRGWHPDPAIRDKPRPAMKCGGNREAVTVIATGGPVEVTGGMGTQMKALLDSLGFKLPCGRCRERMQQMDAWGPAGCFANKDIILDWLREEQKKRSWVEKLRAAGLAVTTGLAFKLDPVDPAVGLFNEAIRRTLKQKEQVQHG